MQTYCVHQEHSNGDVDRHHMLKIESSDVMTLSKMFSTPFIHKAEMSTVQQISESIGELE
jgi:hypothetical protein